MRFKVSLDGTIQGPKEYLESEWFEETKKKIEEGRHPLIGAAPSHIPPAKLLEVILQTDYAAWKGARQLSGAWE